MRVSVAANTLLVIKLLCLLYIHNNIVIINIKSNRKYIFVQGAAQAPLPPPAGSRAVPAAEALRALLMQIYAI